MSPEQARGRDLDGRSDLFSLGCVLYRLCTGGLPFRGEDTTAILTALIHNTPRPVRELNPDVPLVLAELIDRLLAKDPAARPASAQAVAEELQAIEREVPNGAAACAWPPRVLWMAGAALGVVVALVLAVVALMPGSGTMVVRAADEAARGALQKAAVRVVDQHTGEARRIVLGGAIAAAGALSGSTRPAYRTA